LQKHLLLYYTVWTGNMYVKDAFAIHAGFQESVKYSVF
jgi:hypothetical protein